MNLMVNQDILSGKWKQVRGRVKQWWGKMADDDLDYINGSVDALVGKVQEQYGYNREQAEKEVTRFMEQLDQ